MSCACQPVRRGMGTARHVEGTTITPSSQHYGPMYKYTVHTDGTQAGENGRAKASRHLIEAGKLERCMEIMIAERGY